MALCAQMQCCLLKDCFGHDLVIFVPKVQNIDVAMVIEWGTDSARGNRRGSIWRQVGTCNDDLEAQTDEKPPLALQLVQSLDFVTCDKGHATEIAHQERNKMAQLAAMRWRCRELGALKCSVLWPFSSRRLRFMGMISMRESTIMQFRIKRPNAHELRNDTHRISTRANKRRHRKVLHSRQNFNFSFKHPQ